MATTKAPKAPPSQQGPDPVAEPTEAGQHLLRILHEESEDVRLVPWRGKRYHWHFSHDAIERMQRRGYRPMDMFMAALGPLIVATLGSARWEDAIKQAGEHFTDDQRQALRTVIGPGLPRLSTTDLQIAACVMFETGLMSFYDTDALNIRLLFKWQDAGPVVRELQDLAMTVGLERHELQKMLGSGSNGDAPPEDGTAGNVPLP